jgi:hypothetical protein
MNVGIEHLIPGHSKLDLDARESRITSRIVITLIFYQSNTYPDNLSGGMNSYKLLCGAGQGVDRHIYRPTARSDGRSGELSNHRILVCNRRWLPVAFAYPPDTLSIENEIITSHQFVLAKPCLTKRIPNP